MDSMVALCFHGQLVLHHLSLVTMVFLRISALVEIVCADTVIAEGKLILSDLAACCRSLLKHHKVK